MKLFDSELRVMETLWKLGDLTAGQIAKILNQQIGWNRNTTLHFEKHRLCGHIRQFRFVG